jgi:hypothetical protein
VAVIIITNFFLLPLFLSYLRSPPSYAKWVAERRARGDRWRQTLVRSCAQALR